MKHLANKRRRKQKRNEVIMHGVMRLVRWRSGVVGGLVRCDGKMEGWGGRRISEVGLVRWKGGVVGGLVRWVW